MIPTRFQTNCEFCGCELDTRRQGVHQYVEGWVQNRAGGGANAVRLPNHHLRWACKICVDTKSKGQPLFQMNLFGSTL